MPDIHPTAVIDPSSRIGEGVVIGPYTIVEPDVTIGDGCIIGSHVTLGSRLRLGRNVRIFNYACVGTASQDLKHRGEHSFTEIGDDVIIREFVTVNRGTREGSVTRVGARVALLAYAHVAHECVIESDAVLVNAATLGGEVFVGHRAVIGGLTGIHQFCRIGRYTIIGAGSKVVQDLPPYLMADGHPARPYGPNRVGLERAGHSREQIEQIRLIYKLLYDDGLGLEEGMRRIRAEFAGSPFAEEVLVFCQGTSRGISRPRRRHTPDGEAILMEDLTGWME